MNIWIISDTHFNHMKLCVYENRPANFNERIIENWNKLVKREDLVIHLGDVILGKDSLLPAIMKKLNGKKILTRGNHDHKSMEWYMERGFDFVTDYFVYRNIAFSHAPLTPLPLQSNDNYKNPVTINIHGHFHKNLHRLKEDEYFDIEYYKKNTEKYKLLYIEHSYKPVLLDLLIA
jgi:calcineurin-like phosphoesterase family protein